MSIAIIVGSILSVAAIRAVSTSSTNRRERHARPHVVAARSSLLQSIWSRVDADYRFSCRWANGDHLQITTYPVSLTAPAMVEMQITRHSNASYGQQPDVLFYRIYRWNLRVAKALRRGGARSIYQHGYAEAAELREIEKLIQTKHPLVQSPR